MWCGRKTTLSPAEFHITAPTLQRCWIWPYNFKWCHSKKKNTHTHTRISIVHTALLRLCILPLLIEYDLQPPMLLTATWGKVKKKKKKKKKKHIREMNTEQFSDITRKKPQYEFCKQNRNQLGKKGKEKEKWHSYNTLLRIRPHSNFSSSPILSIIACKSKQQLAIWPNSSVILCIQILHLSYKRESENHSVRKVDRVAIHVGWVVFVSCQNKSIILYGSTLSQLI